MCTLWIWGEIPPTRGPLATFFRTGDHNLPISLGKEGPLGSTCPSGVTPCSTYTCRLPSSCFVSGSGQTGPAEAESPSRLPIRIFLGRGLHVPHCSTLQSCVHVVSKRVSKNESMHGHIFELTPLFPHVLPPFRVFPLFLALSPSQCGSNQTSLVLCFMDVLIISREQKKEQILMSEL